MLLDFYFILVFLSFCIDIFFYSTYLIFILLIFYYDFFLCKYFDFQKKKSKLFTKTFIIRFLTFSLHFRFKPNNAISEAVEAGENYQDSENHQVK